MAPKPSLYFYGSKDGYSNIYLPPAEKAKVSNRECGKIYQDANFQSFVFSKSRFQGYAPSQLHLSFELERIGNRQRVWIIVRTNASDRGVRVPHEERYNRIYESAKIILLGRPSPTTSPCSRPALAPETLAASTTAPTLAQQPDSPVDGEPSSFETLIEAAPPTAQQADSAVDGEPSSFETLIEAAPPAEAARTEPSALSSSPLIATEAPSASAHIELETSNAVPAPVSSKVSPMQSFLETYTATRAPLLKLLDEKQHQRELARAQLEQQCRVQIAKAEAERTTAQQHLTQATRQPNDSLIQTKINLRLGSHPSPLVATASERAETPYFPTHMPLLQPAPLRVGPQPLPSHNESLEDQLETMLYGFSAQQEESRAEMGREFARLSTEYEERLAAQNPMLEEPPFFEEEVEEDLDIASEGDEEVGAALVDEEAELELHEEEKEEVRAAPDAASLLPSSEPFVDLSEAFLPERRPVAINGKPPVYVEEVLHQNPRRSSARPIRCKPIVDLSAAFLPERRPVAIGGKPPVYVEEVLQQNPRRSSARPIRCKPINYSEVVGHGGGAPNGKLQGRCKQLVPTISVPSRDDPAGEQLICSDSWSDRFSRSWRAVADVFSALTA